MFLYMKDLHPFKKHWALISIEDNMLRYHTRCYACHSCRAWTKACSLAYNSISCLLFSAFNNLPELDLFSVYGLLRRFRSYLTYFLYLQLNLYFFVRTGLFLKQYYIITFPYKTRFLLDKGTLNPLVIFPKPQSNCKKYWSLPFPWELLT